MTICIGCICENKFVVITSDKMITVRDPNIEYEQKGIEKIIEITPNCLMATAGSAIAYNEILKKTKLDIQANSVNDISRIAEIVRTHYTNSRNKLLEETILSPVGLTLQAFYQSQQALQSTVVGSLMARMQQFNYQLWLLIGGVDENLGHLWHIENPGTKFCLDNIGFHAIGSGQHHATSTFIANEFEPSIDLSHGLAIAYEAKKRSEKATGVGALTDLVIIHEVGYTRLSDIQLGKLEEIYHKHIDTEKAIIKELDKMINGLDFLPGY